MAQSTIKLRMLEVFRFRTLSFLVLVLILFFVLLIQLVNIQIIQGRDYQNKSRMNMENNIPIPAPRGEIYDRTFHPGSEKTVIASNRPSFYITTIPARFHGKDEYNKIIRRLAKLFRIAPDEILQNINSQNPWERITIREDVDFNSITIIASHRDLFPNIEWGNEPVRLYNSGKNFFHAIGYVGSISREEYVNNAGKGYKFYQKIGKVGIESQYDQILRGADGYIRRIVDVRNRVKGDEIGSYPTAGNNLVLTIDAGVQSAASEAMEGQKGAVIVIKPSSGEILAMVSKPDVDPNMLLSRDKNLIIKELNNDKDKPFLNRAIQEKYPPASTFKLVTSIAGLEEGNVNPNLTYYCPGYYILKGREDTKKYCYQIHGTVDMYGAIAHSCSVYFYQLGLKITPTLILKYADYMGFDKASGIDIPGEITGFIPSREWKQRTWGQSWYDGDTVNLSIGQGFINVTAIGLTNFISGIVNNGVVYKPHLVKEIYSPDNSKIIKRFIPERIREVPLSVATLNMIKSGMRKSVTQGTSGRLGYIKVPIAGKTGTAQTVSKRKEDKSQHAWFISYAPYEGNPDNTVAVVVLVEYGRYGADTAVPVAERIYLKLVSLGYFNVP